MTGSINNNKNKFKMKNLSKLVLREQISPAELVSKKSQKWILGGYGGGNDEYDCYCGSPRQRCCITHGHMECAYACVDFCKKNNCG